MVLADLDPVDDTKILLTTEWRHRDQCTSIPGARWDRNQSVWRLPRSWTACLALRDVFGDELKIGDDLWTWAATLRTERIEPALALRQALEADGDPDLFPYQRADVQFLALARRALLGSEPGTGKQQPVSEPVLTPYGWRLLGELRPGDLVTGRDGVPTEVLAIYPQTERRVYKITLNDGAWTYCGPEHLWAARTNTNATRNKPWQIVSTEELKHSLFRRWEIPLIEPISYLSEEDLPIEPYLLGVILGDGSIQSSGAVNLCTDLDILRALGFDSGAVPHKTSSYTATCYIRAEEMVGLFSGKERSWNKTIPKLYMHASWKSRLALLQGLLDTDGSPRHNGGVEYCTTSYQLFEQVIELVQSLGGTARNKEKRNTSYTYAGEKRTGRTAYLVSVKLPTHLEPFRLPRKAKKFIYPTKYHVKRIIRSVEFSHEEDSVCISVAAADGLYVTRSFIVTHNTASTIRTLAELTRRGELVFPALVVTPNSVKFAWKREVERWWPGCTAQVIRGTMAQRRKQLQTPAHFYIINYESLRTHSRLAPYGSMALTRCVACGGHDSAVSANRCEVHPRELNEMTFHTVIADEAHKIRDVKAKQTRALKAATGAAAFRLALTGTPIASDPGDLWSILNWLDPKEWPSRNRWMNRLINITFNAWGGIIVSGIKPEHEQEFFAGLDPSFRRMTKDVVLPWLPPLIEERRDLEMSPRQRKMHDEMRDRMIAEMDSGAFLVATSPLVKTIRLLQLASSGGEVDGATNRLLLTEPSNKIDAFLEDLPDFGGQSIVVFAVSRQLIELLSAKLLKHHIPHGLITGRQHEVARQEAVESFQAGKTKLILCTIQAGGIGITLSAASVMVFLQRSWSLVDMKQATDRCHRIGSEVHSSILRVDYVTPGTIEEAVIGSLNGKGVKFEELVRDQQLLRKALEGGT